MLQQKPLWELFSAYVIRFWPRILQLTWQHITISFIALAITLVVCIPLGIYLTKNENLPHTP